MQPRLISVDEAIALAPSSAIELAALAAQQRFTHKTIDHYQTRRHWQAAARTWCYHTHIAISGQALQRLEWLAGIFYDAASLNHQPWYPAFQGGKTMQLNQDLPAGIDRQQLCWASFDLGLGKPRYYRQLLSLARPDALTAVIVAHSVNDGPPLPEGAHIACTLQANGEVFHWQDNTLHWHHICTTAGAALLPGSLDRWFINALRLFGLDNAERSTYRQEAEQLRDWLQGANPEQDIIYK